MPLALFGITNDGLNLAVNLVVLFLVVVWIALVVWTYLDARRRLSDPVLVGAATIASLFPFVGTIVYSILRPPEFLDDRRERELEIRASELRVRQLEEQSCPNCNFPIERAYLRCPNCRARVKDPCESCGKPIDPRWALCPYCESAVRRAAPEGAPKRSSRSKGSSSGPPPAEQRRRKPPTESTRSPEAPRRKAAPRDAETARPPRPPKQRQPAKARSAPKRGSASEDDAAPAGEGTEERTRPAKS